MKLKKYYTVIALIIISAVGFSFTTSDSSLEPMTKVIVTVHDMQWVNSCGQGITLSATGNSTVSAIFIPNQDTYTFFISGYGSGTINAHLAENSGCIVTQDANYRGGWCYHNTVNLTVHATNLCL